MDTKDTGSLRCCACNCELKENEYVLCEECEIRSIEIEDLLKQLDTEGI